MTTPTINPEQIKRFTAILDEIRNLRPLIGDLHNIGTDEGIDKFSHDVAARLKVLRNLLSGPELSPAEVSAIRKQRKTDNAILDEPIDNARPSTGHPPTDLPPQPIPDEMSTFTSKVIAIAEAQERNAKAGAPLFDVLQLVNGKFLVHRANQPSGGVQPVWTP